MAVDPYITGVMGDAGNAWGGYPVQLISDVSDATGMRVGNTLQEMQLSDPIDYTADLDWTVRTGGDSVSVKLDHAKHVFVEYLDASDNVIGSYYDITVPAIDPTGQLNYDLPTSNAPTISDEAVWSQSFENSHDFWISYDYSGPDQATALGNFFYPATWHPTGGVDNSGYVSVDDSRWRFDPGENLLATTFGAPIFAISTRGSYYDNPQPQNNSGPYGYNNFTSMTVDFYLNSSNLDLHGGQAYFWLFDDNGRTVKTSQPLNIGDGTWAFNEVTLDYSPDNPDWQLIWDPGGNPTIDLTKIAAWGVVILGPEQIGSNPVEPTGVLELDDFQIRPVEINEVIQDASNNDTVWSGTSNNDEYIGGAGNDTLSGLDGNDVLHGGDGDDRLIGGAGDDILQGDAGHNTLIGGTGDDRYYVASANDIVQENANEGTADWVLVEPTFTGTYVLPANIEKLSASDTTGTEHIDLTGNALDNTIFGNAAGNVLHGMDGNDTLYGYDGNDTLYGDAGDDILWGGNGQDTMVGGAGNDWFYVDNSGDIVIEGANEGSLDRILSSVNYTLGAGVYVEILTTTDNGGIEAINFTGNELGNTIYGNDGENILDGKDGSDTLLGLGGNDTYYVDNAGDQITEFVGGGYDTVFSSVSYTLGSGEEIEKLTPTDRAGTLAINFTGNEFNNTIYGNAGDNTLDGAGGNDLLIGLGGDDTYIVDSASDQVFENANQGNDTVLSSVSYSLYGGVSVETLATTDAAGTDPLVLAGNELTNTIIGNAGNNTLYGGGGGDTLIGGAGNDQYIVYSAADVIVENVGEGNDRVFANVSYILGHGVEVETLSTSNNAGTDPIHLTGNEFNNTIYGNAGDNILDGGSGSDTLLGLGGNDTYYVDNAGDQITEFVGGGYDTVFSSVSYTLGSGEEIEKLTPTDRAGTLAINFTGNEFNNTIYGNAGDNTLDGAGGNDLLIGLGGDDTYIVDSASDQVFENANQGNDTVLSSVSYSLYGGVSVETLATTDAAGTDPLVLAGNELTNTIIGNAGNNTLYGGGGGDTLIGGAGNDEYIVYSAADVIVENVGEGNDRVYANVSYTMGHGVEVETLSTGNNAGTDPIHLTGNEFNNTIYGNAGDNILDGGSGSDTLVGLGGNDTYYVDNAGDYVYEAANQGNDTVLSSVSYSLYGGVSVETLATTDAAGTDPLVLAGNELTNTIIGNAGNNTLYGGGGGDTLIGGAGNDQYIVYSAADVIVENVGEGNDRVFANVSYTLGHGVEVETLSTSNNAGTAAINLTGNEFNNYLSGNAGDNILDGGSGNDTLVGGDGNDTYIVDNASDQVYESAGQGNDTVLSSVSYSLRAGISIETLAAANSSGTDAINLTGNELANTIGGNAGNNVLDGKGGNDTLTGLGGNDTFVFSTPLNSTTNVCTITDFTAGNDKLDLVHSVFTALSAGALPSDDFFDGTAAQTTNQHLVYDSHTGNLYYDADGNGAQQQTLFASLTNGVHLNASDILVT